MAPPMSNRVKKTKYQKRTFLHFALNLKNIPYNGDTRETLDRVHVKYFLPKGAFMSKTVDTLVQQVDLIWLKGGLYFSHSGQKGNLLV